jgi:hypothetical protein
MSKRLQVVLEDSEAREVRRLARMQHMTVSEWVRQALRTVRRQEPGTDGAKKLQVVRAAAQHAFPTGDMDQILSEIEHGYLNRS